MQMTAAEDIEDSTADYNPFQLVYRLILTGWSIGKNSLQRNVKARPKERRKKASGCWDNPSVLVEGCIKNAIVAPATDTTLFALRDFKNTKLGPHLRQLVRDKFACFDVASEIYFPELYSSTTSSLSMEDFE